MTLAANPTPLVTSSASGLSVPGVSWPRTHGTGLLQWISLATAVAAHAAAIGYALAAGLLSPGSHGAVLEAIGVEIVLSDVIAARELMADGAAGSILPLAATTGVASLALPQPVARPDKREWQGETAEAAPRPRSEGFTVLAAPDAPETAAAQTDQAVTPEPRPELEEPLDPAAKPKPQATTTARIEPQSAPDRPPSPRDKAVPAGGSAAESRRSAASLPARAAATPGEISSYEALVRSRIASRKPASVGVRGSPTVSFVIAPSGALSYARLGKSSGHARLDDLALRSVRAAAPFPAPPRAMTRAQLSYRIPFHFE